MRLRSLAVLPVLVPVLAGTALPAPAASAATVTTVAAPTAALPQTATAPLSYAMQLHILTNEQRKAHGLRPLAGNTCAGHFAGVAANRMSHYLVMRHQSLNPLFVYCHASRAGENIAYGNWTPRQMMDAWMRSPSHRANILNPNYNVEGIAAARGRDGRVYASQVFLRV